ncbi:MAG: hypothetical protein WC055_13290 [Melioribacteraceae bacterium]
MKPSAHLSVRLTIVTEPFTESDFFRFEMHETKTIVNRKNVTIFDSLFILDA